MAFVLFKAANLLATAIVCGTLVDLQARFVVTFQCHAVWAVTVGVSRHVDTTVRATVSTSSQALVHIDAFAAAILVLVSARFFDKAWQAPALKAALGIEALLVWSAGWDSTVALVNVQAGFVVWPQVKARGTEAEHNTVAVNALMRAPWKKKTHRLQNNFFNCGLLVSDLLPPLEFTQPFMLMHECLSTLESMVPGSPSQEHA